MVAFYLTDGTISNTELQSVTTTMAKRWVKQTHTQTRRVSYNMRVYRIDTSQKREAVNGF